MSNAPARMPTNELDVQRMRADQALRILETLNAAGAQFSVRFAFAGREPNRTWLVESVDGERCRGVTLTDALAQFATAVGLDAPGAILAEKSDAADRASRAK